MARAEALPMMHHHSGEVVEEVLGARRARGAGAAGNGAGHTFGRGLEAAVGLHVEELVEADVDSDLLPVVPPRPPEAFEVKPQDLRQFVDHQLFLCFSQEDRFGGGAPSS